MVWDQVHGASATIELLENPRLNFTLAPFSLQNTKTYPTYNRMLVLKKKMVGYSTCSIIYV